jgi:hypothetical protein
VFGYHSIVSSACAMSCGETSIPSDFATFRLITNSNVEAARSVDQRDLHLSKSWSYTAARRNIAGMLGP